MLYLGSLLYNIPTWIITTMLLVGIFGFYSAGAWLGNYKKKNDPEFKAEGLGPLEGAVLGLLALILSFTFGMSASRYNTRLSHIVEEANYIGTALLRADLYPDSTRQEFRKDFQQYVEARIAYHDARNNEMQISKALDETAKIADRIWQRAARFSKGSSSIFPHNVMIPALNSMIDSVTTRDAGRLAIVPDLIVYLLIILTLLGSMIVGYSKREKRNDWIILSIYSLMTVVTIYTVLDLDRPSRGIIKTNFVHQKIIDLRELFD